MGKAVVTSIRVDEDVLREAKALGLNVSKVAENALREAVRRLKGEYFKTEPNSPSVNVGECGRRDLNPGHWLGRPRS
jgi:post-segregation antitoxin (ccd killing protein)